MKKQLWQNPFVSLGLLAMFSSLEQFYSQIAFLFSISFFCEKQSRSSTNFSFWNHIFLPKGQSCHVSLSSLKFSLPPNWKFYNTFHLKIKLPSVWKLNYLPFEKYITFWIIYWPVFLYILESGSNRSQSLNLCLFIIMYIFY